MRLSLSLQNLALLSDVPGLSAHQVGTYLGYLGAALGAAMVVPQIARTLRHRHMTGVSILSWTLTVFACSDWLLYGIRAREAVQIPGNALLIAGAIAVVLIVPGRLAVPVRALGLGAGITALALLATVLPPDVIGTLAIVIGVSSSIPQVIRSIRRPVDELSAVSLSTWYMRVASQACWVGFALLVHDQVVLASACYTEICNLTVLLTELRRASTASRTSALPPRPLPTESTAPQALAAPGIL